VKRRRACCGALARERTQKKRTSFLLRYVSKDFAAATGNESASREEGAHVAFSSASVPRRSSVSMLPRFCHKTARSALLTRLLPPRYFAAHAFQVRDPRSRNQKGAAAAANKPPRYAGSAAQAGEEVEGNSRHKGSGEGTAMEGLRRGRHEAAKNKIFCACRAQRRRVECKTSAFEASPLFPI